MTSPSKDRRPTDVLKNLPQKIEVEKSFLGSVLLDNSVLDREVLTPKDFHFPFHRQIYEAMLEMWEDRIGIDPVTLADRMEKTGIDLGGGRREFLEELSWIVPTAANAPHYAEILREVAARRQAIFDADKLNRAANSGVPEDIARVRAEIAKAPSSEKSERLGWTKYRVDIAHASTVKPPDQKFVVGHLPDEPGNYGLIIGPDGVRKSWLALHVGLSVAGGRPVAQGPDGSCLWIAPTPGRVVYITSEDSPEVIWRRVWNIGQMPGYGWIKEREVDERIDILSTFSNLALLSTAQDGSIVQTPEYNELVEYAKGSRLVILDPLADLFDLDENGNREGRAIVQALRQLSLLTGAGVLGVHHQNKASMLAGEKNHQSGRGSSKFGAGCRWAVVLQPISQALGAEGAEKVGIPEKELSDWTNIHESKASYAIEVAGDQWLRKMGVVDDDGRLTLASAPLAAKLPEERNRVNSCSEGVEYATAY